MITFNEEENIQRALESVSWAEEILVVDSGSTDQTREIAKKQHARVIQNPWPGYGQQKNFAQNHASHDWILNIDADEVVPKELSEEICDVLSQINQNQLKAAGFFMPRKTFYLGRWIKHGGWYPNYLVRLANRQFAKWSEPSVHEELCANGQLRYLKHALHHYAFSSIEDQVLTNLRFSKLGSLDLQKAGQQASVPRIIFKPIGKFIETYFFKKGFLDGLPGFIICMNAAHSMFLKYAYLSETKIRIHK
jgi:glycosyltransferase involved in cell wall biosynthesis